MTVATITRMLIPGSYCCTLLSATWPVLYKSSFFATYFESFHSNKLLSSRHFFYSITKTSFTCPLFIFLFAYITCKLGRQVGYYLSTE